MGLRAGFAEIDITPPVGCQKIGWLKVIVSNRVADPLYVRAAVFDSAGQRIGLIQFDTLFVPATLVAEVRRRIEVDHGFPAGHVMFAATHNHAGPAVDNVGAVQRDDEYVKDLTARTVRCFGQAVEAMQPAEIGFARRFEFAVGHNRRIVMRDGTVRTHGAFADPEALCFEGPIDPEVAILGVRAPGGAMLGALVNFACHPAHHGGDEALSAGYPGVLAERMKSQDCPVTMFCLGAAGNISTADPTGTAPEPTMVQAGEALARHIADALDGMAFTADVRLASRSKTVRLPFREITDEQIRGTVRGAQRFVDPTIYDDVIPAEVERIRRLGGAEAAEVQVLRINDVALAAIPGELFVELGLRIKARAWPAKALVVSCANGRLGYLPTREAFDRGGYETTFGPSSCMAPEAGDLLADAAIELIAQDP